MTRVPAGQKWLPRQPNAQEPIGPGLEVVGVRLERVLTRHHLGERWLAREPDGMPRLAYRIDLLAGARSARAFRQAAEMLLHLRHSHLLPIMRLDPDAAGGRWIACPFVGNSGGVVTLSDLLRQREPGRLRPIEVMWSMSQILEAVAAAHRQGHCHGAFRADEVAVDRHGSVVVELYGLGRRLRGMPAADRRARALETRSVVELGLHLATGREFTGEVEGRRGEIRALGGLGRWLDAGLSATGFDGAEAALAGVRDAISREGRAGRRPAAIVGSAT